MATKDTVKRLNGELREANEKLEYLKIKEPDQYFIEKPAIEEKIRTIKLQLFRIIVEDYPKQNPVKWMEKKERLLAKLAFMEAGGLEENFVYQTNTGVSQVGATNPQPQQEVQQEKFICPICQFEAKTNAGLSKHSVKHKGEPQNAEGQRNIRQQEGPSEEKSE